VEAFETVAREYRAVGRRNRHAALGIEPQHRMGDEPIHPLTPHWAEQRPARSPGRFGFALSAFRRSTLRDCGISWDNMGVNGTTRHDHPKQAAVLRWSQPIK